MEVFTLASSDLSFVFWLTALAFVLAIALTPMLTDFLYRNEVWKKPKDTAITGEKAPVYQKLHAAKHRRKFPTMAGVLMWEW